MSQEVSEVPTSDWLGLALHDVFWRASAGFVFFFCLVPPEGIPGFEMCASMRFSHAPCPGCGMTRCGSNLIRGNYYRAFQYHPLGVVVIPLSLTFAAFAFTPRSWREAVRGKLARMPRPYSRVLFWVALLVFFGFGALRWGLVLTQQMNFPLDGF